MILSLDITNTYESGDEIKTEANDIEVPDPTPADLKDDLYEWGLENIMEYTGTGRTEGDAWYDVVVTASDRPDLVSVGRKFDFGY